MTNPYVFNVRDLASLVLPRQGNNPAAPLFDCVSMNAYYKDSKRRGQKDLFLFLTFGTHALHARDGDKVLKFSVRLKKAQLRVCKHENVHLMPSSMFGADEPIQSVKTVVKAKNSTQSKAEAKAKIGISPKQEILNVSMAAGIEGETAQQLLSEMSSQELNKLVSYKSLQHGNYTWEALPRVIDGTNGGGQKYLHDTYFSISSGKLLSFKPSTPQADVCVMLGITAHPDDIAIDIVEDNDSPWWNAFMKTTGYRSKLEAAKIAISRILTQGTGQETDLTNTDKYVFFAIAAAVPEDV